LDRHDLLDFDATTRLLDRYRPDVVMHCAAERRLDAFRRPGEIVEDQRRVDEAPGKESAANKSSNANEGYIGDGPYMVFVSTDGLTTGMFQMDDAEAGDWNQGGGDMCRLFVGADNSNQRLSFCVCIRVVLVDVLY